MVRETNCVIHLNSIGGATNNVYFSGQSISGNVVLSLYEKQIIKGNLRDKIIVKK